MSDGEELEPEQSEESDVTDNEGTSLVLYLLLLKLLRQDIIWTWNATSILNYDITKQRFKNGKNNWRA